MVERQASSPTSEKRNRIDSAASRIQSILRHLGIWTLVGLFISSQMMVSAEYIQEEKPNWMSVLVTGMIAAHVWGLFSIFIHRVVRSFPLDRNFLWQGLIMHVGMLGLFTLGYGLFAATFLAEEGKNEKFAERLIHFVSMTFHAQLLIYATIATVLYFREAQKQNRSRASQLTQMQIELSQTQLNHLRAQLHPHFLFNTLNTVTGLIEEDPESAILVTARLSELLRAALEAGEKEVVELREELDFISKYVDIQQIRFGSRLDFNKEVCSETLNALVPYLILQPLIENAVKYGMATSSKTCRVALKTERLGKHLRIEISDSGAGFNAEPEEMRVGIGLSNTQKRMKLIYGDQGAFEYSTVPGKGTQVTLTLPIHVQNQIASTHE